MSIDHRNKYLLFIYGGPFQQRSQNENASVSKALETNSDIAVDPNRSRNYGVHSRHDSFLKQHKNMCLAVKG